MTQDEQQPTEVDHDAEADATEATDDESTEADDIEDAAAEDAAAEDAAAEDAAAEDAVTAPSSSRSGRVAVAALLALALVASAGVAAFLYFKQYRPDSEVNKAAEKSAVEAASEGTVALLSYAPDTLDKDFADAKTHLTGDFLSYYPDFTTKVVTPAAPQKKVKTTAKVVQGAVSDMTSDTATVLLFINQTTTSQDLPDGSFAISSVKVGMVKNDGRWLISTFDPV